MRDSPRPCVICGHEDGVVVHRVDQPVCGLGQVRFAIRLCDACGMVQQAPRVPDETLDRQYRLFSNYTRFETGAPPLTPTAGRFLALLEAHGVARGRAYDVGAATGGALFHLRRAGWAVGGCDPSPRAVHQATTAHGIDLHVGGVQDMAGAHGADLVLFAHVLEHLADPVAALRRVRSALAPGGRLLVEVPCLTAPDRNPPGLFMMEHLNYFDAASLANLMRVSGFEIVEALTTLDGAPYPFPVITVLARAADPAPMQPDFDARAVCAAYLARDASLWAGADARLRTDLAPGQPVVIWGAGLHTSSLLERTGLADHARILAVTDRDPQKWGHAIGPHAVVPPDQALAMDACIVISSHVSQDAIARALNAQGVDEARLVRCWA